MKNAVLLTGLAAAGVLFTLTPKVWSQGALTPPGAPAPLFKTLQQVEPRVPVDAEHTPGDASNLYKITSPGSYYLTGNIAVAAGRTPRSGISIQSDNVVLDLNGFSLTGETGTLNGIAIGSYDNIQIRNGTISSFGSDGIAAATATRARLEHLSIAKNTKRGITGGFDFVVRACSLGENGDDGAYFNNTVTLTEVTSSQNKGEGIHVEHLGVISRCVVRDNGSTGIRGIDRANISDCIVVGNGTIDGNSGIKVYFAGSVRRCTADFNHGHGIVCDYQSGGGGCVIQENETSNNTVHGISIVTSGNRIDSNQSSYNSQNGIYILNSNPTHPSANVVIRNTAAGNSGGNYSIAVADNTYGTILTATGATSSSAAWANFSL